jgi:branched-chain amino acid transport system substrate-binding protein
LGVNRPFSGKLAAGILGILQHYNKVGEVKPDDQVKHEMYFMKVKSPLESKTRGDFCSVLAEIPGDRHFARFRKSTAG